MNRFYRSLSLLSGTLAILVLVAGPVAAEVTIYTAVLSGANEVPAVATPATGVATLTLDDSNGFITTAPLLLEFSGLRGTQNAAHIHQAPAGSNGPAIFGLPLGSPVDILVPLDQVPIASLEAGNLYINIHTDYSPAGELRGQFLLQGSVDVEKTNWGAIKALFRAE